jgi:hypothetical protein
MDEVYYSRPHLMDAPLSHPEFKLFTNGSRFIQNPDLQSPMLTTSYRLKPYHKAVLHNELNFGHWSRHYEMQRESG